MLKIKNTPGTDRVCRQKKHERQGKQKVFKIQKKLCLSRVDRFFPMLRVDNAFPVSVSGIPYFVMLARKDEK
jgi:hypothetical protein